MYSVTECVPTAPRTSFWDRSWRLCRHPCFTVAYQVQEDSTGRNLDLGDKLLATPPAPHFQPTTWIQHLNDVPLLRMAMLLLESNRPKRPTPTTAARRTMHHSRPRRRSHPPRNPNAHSSSHHRTFLSRRIITSPGCTPVPLRVSMSR